MLNAALRPFAEQGREITRILLLQTSVHPCVGCETSVARGACRPESGGMEAVYQSHERCHAMRIAFPVDWLNIPAQLKAVFDRIYAVSAGKPLDGKLGGAIGRGAGGGQAIVLNIIHNFYLSSGMLCMPGELHGVSACVDQPGDILSRPKRLRQTEALRRNILRFVSTKRP